MSILSTKYYIFIKNHVLNFNKILNDLDTNNGNLRSWCLQYDFINCQLQDLLKNYPEFLNYSHFIDYKINLYNQNKILSSTTMSVDQLKTAIKDENCFTLLNTISNIPNTYDEMVKEYTLQSHYVNPYSLLYDKNLFIYNYNPTADYVQNFSSLLNDTYNDVLNNYQISTLNNQSFFHLYFLQSLMNNYFEMNSTLKNNLLNNTNQYDITVDLAAVIDNNIQTIIPEVIQIVLQNQYSFNNISSNFISNISQDINIINSITNIKDIFQDYYNQNYKEFKVNYTQTCFEQYNNTFTFDFINTIFNSSNIFNFIGIDSITTQLYSVSNLSQFENLQLQQSQYADTLNTFEQQTMLFYQNTLNSFTSLRQYFYLLYLNRNKYQKFINIIDLVASTYVQNNITFSDIYYFNNSGQLQILFNTWLQNIYYQSFLNSLKIKFNKAKQLQFLTLNTNAIRFSFIYEIYNIIEEFLKTDAFNEYILQIQKDIYNNLRANGNIANNTDWCSCDLPLRVYFMSLLKQLILDPDAFSTTDTITYMSDQISNSNYSIISTQDDFISFAQEFINLNAPSMFDFYKTFLTSLTGSIFSQAIHNIYSL